MCRAGKTWCGAGGAHATARVFTFLKLCGLCGGSAFWYTAWCQYTAQCQYAARCQYAAWSLGIPVLEDDQSICDITVSYLQIVELASVATLVVDSELVYNMRLICNNASKMY